MKRASINNDEDIEMILLMSRKRYPSLCEALKEMVNETGEIASSCSIF